MVRAAHIFIEGAESREDQIRCREAFVKLLEKSGFAGRMPRLTACGSRNSAFDDFQTAHAQGQVKFVAMLVDSEDPVSDVDQTWVHLRTRDGWVQPAKAANEQVFLMATCMEAWIVADQSTLRGFYKKLQANALPALNELENRGRHEVQDKLFHATRNCSNAYSKGKRSFEVLGQLDVSVLRQHLPSFARMVRILQTVLDG